MVKSFLLHKKYLMEIFVIEKYYKRESILKSLQLSDFSEIVIMPRKEMFDIMMKSDFATFNKKNEYIETFSRYREM